MEQKYLSSLSRLGQSRPHLQVPANVLLYMNFHPLWHWINSYSRTDYTQAHPVPPPEGNDETEQPSQPILVHAVVPYGFDSHPKRRAPNDRFSYDASIVRL